ncbi:Ribokinase-like protein [Spinellus fusiger]|nr:Ribokinase-like protein [Spinellus fusiger]
MDILGAMDPHKIHQTIADIGAGMVCVDGNLSALTLHAIVVECSKRKIPVFFEPTSVPKSVRLLENPETLACGAVQFISPNQYELEAMVDTAKRTLPPMTLDIWQKIDGPRVAQQMLPLATYLSHSIPNVITKLGEDGCLYVQNKASHVAYFPPETVLPEQIKSVTGAGDCFVGTLLANLMHSRPHPVPWSALIQQSQKSSVLTLQSALAVSQSISDALLVKS